MNKKVLMLTMTLLAVVMMATPLIGTAQACRRRTVERYSVEYTMFTVSPPNPPEFIGNHMILSGAVSEGAYDGPLGAGTMTAELIEGRINLVTGESRFAYKNTLAITDGPHGTGTLTGFSYFKLNWFDIPIEATGITFLSGTGELEGIRVFGKKGFTVTIPGPAYVWEDGWMILPEDE